MTMSLITFSESERAEIVKKFAALGYVARWNPSNDRVLLDCKCGDDFADAPHVMSATQISTSELRQKNSEAMRMAIEFLVEDMCEKMVEHERLMYPERSQR
jgi:hypothetical protein